MYEQIRKRINELVPELLELKFGCEVKVYVDGEYTCIRPIQYLDYSDTLGIEWECEEYEVSTIQEMQSDELCFLEILGTPPTLQDLLLAIERNQPNVYLGFELRNTYLELIEDYYLTKSLKENIEQNPELAEFISNLLK